MAPALAFDAYSCVAAREVPADWPPEAGDFFLEAPLAVWRETFTSLDRAGRIDAAHSINTLTHRDTPIRVVSDDPAGHDERFRYQESIQLVFDLGASIEAGRNDVR